MHTSNILLLAFGIAILVLAISYPAYRDWIFDSIPRSWTLSEFKIGVIISSAIILLVTLFYCILPLRHRDRLPQPQHWRILVAVMAVLLTVLIGSMTFFYPQYTNDRAWVTASYSSMTQQEVELQTIGQVMQVDGIIGFHYRALFLKFFQWLFFPLALILPSLFWIVRSFITQGLRGIRLPLIVAILMFVSYFILGLWLYG